MKYLFWSVMIWCVLGSSITWAQEAPSPEKDPCFGWIVNYQRLPATTVTKTFAPPQKHWEGHRVGKSEMLMLEVGGLIAKYIYQDDNFWTNLRVFAASRGKVWFETSDGANGQKVFTPLVIGPISLHESIVICPEKAKPIKLTYLGLNGYHCQFTVGAEL